MTIKSRFKNAKNILYLTIRYSNIYSTLQILLSYIYIYEKETNIYIYYSLVSFNSPSTGSSCQNISRACKQISVATMVNKNKIKQTKKLAYYIS